ncbi:NAD(P)H-hydrate dehydratase [Methanocella conradii]|uniref:NAD(P)H-hydrate dehydratase n=1 Tax=Methanocella conradii TaxID=1175444 RepID=UPI0020C62D24|nr:NAD(P)H-hydrate dehydratase [Methanocella conradii]
MTVEEMRALEANSDYFGVTYGMLMENAGRKAAESIIASYKKCMVLVVCGTGNNGGDGAVVARLLANAGYNVMVILLGRVGQVKHGPALINLEIVRGMDIPVIEAATPGQIPEEAFAECDLIVDAILGTGFHGTPREPARTAIRLINESKAHKVSLDLPSGLDANTGECVECVCPDLVIAFHAPKKGLERYRVEVVDIGIPEKALTHIGPGDLIGLKTRGDFVEKGGGGRLLVIGGGPYTGAPTFTALAAYRSGAEIVTVAAPRRAANIIASFSPDLIVRPLSHEDVLVTEDVPMLKKLIERHHAVAVGMGLGREPETLAAVKEILPLCERVVIDADALQPDMPLHGIITPNVHEFERLSGEHLGPHDDAAEIVKAFSAKNGLVTLWKGSPAVVSDGNMVKVNSTGNPGMAVGGAGDVLAGIVGAFYCRNPAYKSACAAAFISGTAGDMAFEDKGYGMMASDMLNMIPYAVKKYWPRKEK